MRCFFSSLSTLGSAGRAMALLVVPALTLALTLGVTTLSSPSVAATTAPARVQVASVAPSYDTLVLQYTNRARRAHGLRPLRAAYCLDRFATRWTHYMATYDSFRHQALRPIMRTCNQRTAGENIARGRGTLGASRVVSMWMHSPGHRRNILNRNFRYLAVDAWRSRDSGQVYVTQDFAG